jgi:RHS repeat-associated protein
VELDETATPLTYEEFHPFGTTAIFAGLARKRYRYTGKERDEETGFCLHGARYYAPWIGRWTSSDPSEMVDGPNLFAYVANSPIKHMDDSGRDLSTPKTTPQKQVPPPKPAISGQEIKATLHLTDDQLRQVRAVMTQEQIERKVAAVKERRGAPLDPIGEVQRRTDLRGAEIIAKAGYVLAALAVLIPGGISLLAAGAPTVAGAGPTATVVAGTVGGAVGTHPEVLDEAEQALTTVAENPELVGQAEKVVEGAEPELQQLGNQAAQQIATKGSQGASSVVDATIHGAERLAERGFTTEMVNLTKSGDVLRQADGATVYLKEVAPGKFNVIVEGSRGVVTALRNLSDKAVSRLANNYGWRK